jgi:hypothetical protein
MVRFLADHDDINIVQPNEIKPDEISVTRGMMYPAPPVPDGIGIEWYAEKNVYAVMSNCPYRRPSQIQCESLSTKQASRWKRMITRAWSRVPSGKR